MSKSSRSSFQVRPLVIAGLVASSLLLGATASAAEAAPISSPTIQSTTPVSFNDGQGEDEEDDVFDETIEFLEDIIDWLI